MSFGAPVRNGVGIGLRASTALSTRGGGASGPSGQAAFTTAGTFSWTAPEGVTSVCVVCVGGGSHRAAGGLGWKNSITVIPGNSYSLRVGNRSASQGVDAQSSYFVNEATVKGGGGSWSGIGGTFTGDGGGNGGGGAYFSGGGAGGYTGNGGAGQGPSTSNGLAGAGGGGGSGGMVNDSDIFFFGGGGGGVGILGQGADGAAGVVSSGVIAGGGGGGSGGANGATGTSRLLPGNGGLYGGAGGSGYNSNTDTQTYTLGVAGAVRIIWGGGRAFPATNTGDV